jgi:two-component system sensor histidine kinase ChvG
MKLRNQLLTLSLATLLVPWFGWKLVQELEQFLRAGQESALLASARTVARALPAEHQSRLIFGRERILPLREMVVLPHLDGYTDDWPEADKATIFNSKNSKQELRVAAGRFGNQLYLLCTVIDTSPVRQSLPSATQGGVVISDGLSLFLRSARGLINFRIHTAAPGPLNLTSLTEGGGQLQGYWLDRADGYVVELSLPLSSELVDLSIGAIDAQSQGGIQGLMTTVGTVENDAPASWLSLVDQSQELNSWLSSVIPEGSRAWIIDAGSWVMADSGSTPAPPGRELSFAERLLYRAIAGSRTEILASREDQLIKFDEEIAGSALAGNDARHWSQDEEDALVRNSVSVPIELSGKVRGAVIIEANSDGMLLVTNRALGRLLLSTLLLTFGLAAGLWFFASRLSRRVQRLSSAVSRAMDDTANPGVLPMTADRDELGELARNNAHLLKAISNYTNYLQKLAGRLSHELKTPLAITRSSLDNLVSQELNEEASRYVERAREGLDRQAAIVSAMSEASRLEATVESAEWEVVNLVSVIGHCVDAYRGVYPGRDIRFEVTNSPITLRCAPDMLAQALDKLVENAMSLSGPSDQVEVRLEYMENDCLISVINSGTRLPDMLPEQLFDSLVTMREKSGGRHLGLGLYIVRLVAEAHGGHVRAGNLKADSGVEFVITLPLGIEATV